MLIETQYDIGDKVWIKIPGYPDEEVEVRGIEVIYHETHLICKYNLKSKYFAHPITLPDTWCAPSKEELPNYMTSDKLKRKL